MKLSLLAKLYYVTRMWLISEDTILIIELFQVIIHHLIWQIKKILINPK